MALKRKRILVAGRNREFVLYVSVLLRKMGFTVLPADDGREAMKLIGIMPPDLVILEAAMPCVGGVSLLSKIKENPWTSRIPVVMLTGGRDGEGVKGYERLEESGLLSRPSEQNELHGIFRDRLFEPLGYNIGGVV